MIRLKDGVIFGELTPAGARILEVLKHLAGDYPFDITITAARNGEHLPDSAHYTGEAFDIRIHGLTAEQVRRFVMDLQVELYRDPRQFFVQVEDIGKPNGHIHVQRRNGWAYGMLDYLRDL